MKNTISITEIILAKISFGYIYYEFSNKTVQLSAWQPVNNITFEFYVSCVEKN